MCMYVDRCKLGLKSYMRHLMIIIKISLYLTACCDVGLLCKTAAAAMM